MRFPVLPSLSIVSLLAPLALAACVSMPLLMPGEHSSPLAGAEASSAHRETSRPTLSGTVTVTVAWPERRDYRSQAIPLRTNALTVQVLDTSNHVLASAVLSRPQAGTLPTTANLSVPAGPNRLVVVKAYQEQVPGFDSLPLAQGSATVTVEPSSEVTADLTLVPADMPEILSIPANGAPLSSIAIDGSGFEGWGQPVEVRFGGILAPYVSGTESRLSVVVPSDAEDGPITVKADGLTATSSESFRIIRGLSLSPESAVASAGARIDYALSAIDRHGASIPEPNVAWFFEQTYPILPPPPGTPASILLDGHFTPGSTGSYEIRIVAGRLVATASVTVN
ncbi:hypothetical protein J7643_08785 [bacterium]|nr:hypothetical protein [bacterium]